MKQKILSSCMNTIKKSDLSYSNEKLEEIEYGLEAIYMMITKTVIIFTIAALLGVWRYLFIFFVIYTVIRMPSFGLHATKSIYCLLSSLLVFLLGMYTAIFIHIPLYIKTIVGIYCIIRMFQNAPADTEKRPIINPKRRAIYKFISTIIAIIFAFTSVLIKNNFISNSFIITLLIQVGMISPFVYKLFKLPYNNYKRYLLNDGLN